LIITKPHARPEQRLPFVVDHPRTSPLPPLTLTSCPHPAPCCICVQSLQWQYLRRVSHDPAPCFTLCASPGTPHICLSSAGDAGVAGQPPPFTRRGAMESVVVAPFAPRAESQFWAHAPAADNEFASTDDAGEEMGWSRPQDVWAAPSTPSSRATTSATSQLSSQGSGNEILGGAPQTVADSVSATASLWATTPPMASSPQNHSHVGSDQYE
jgi:hypothetical protein